MAGAGISTIGIGAFGISKLVKSSGNDKINKPSTDSTADPNPESNNSKDQDDDSVKKDKSTSKPSTDSAADPNPEPNNSKDQDNNSVKKDKSTSEPSTDSTADPIPEPDKPTDSKKEEKEPEKNPSEKPKEEEKGGFGEWCKNHLGVPRPLTLLYVYISYIFVYTIVAGLIQRIRADDIDEEGIYFDLAGSKGDSKKEINIKPFFGWWEDFTSTERFDEDDDNEGTTRPYKGFERILVNLLAAATFAKYW